MLNIIEPKDHQDHQSRIDSFLGLLKVYQSFSLIEEVVNEVLQRKGQTATVKQAQTCFEEIYFNSVQKDPSKVDNEFGEWWIDLVLG